MSDVQFNDEVVTETIRRVVAGAGEDYVYPPSKAADPELRSCRYEDEHGGCIVGRVFGILAPEKELVEFTAADGQGLARDDLITAAAEQALFTAQSMQDAGETFGEALAGFERRLERERRTY